MFVIGVDTGGTFTDIVAIDDRGVLTTAKALSTPPDFARGVVNAVDRLAEELRLDNRELLDQTSVFAFGTTVATNAILTGAGSKTGLLITKGAGDTLNIARGMSQWAGLPDVEAKHQAAHQKPEPIVPNRLLREVIERTDWKGAVVVPLNKERLKEQIEELVAQEVEGIAVCYLWSVRNNSHERETVRLLKELYPDIYTSASSEVSPALGEYERFSTTVLDAYVGSVTRRFLASLEGQLRGRGLKSDLLVMKADGGTTFSADVLPFATIDSGPAGGVVGARFMGQALGYKDILTTDVGGTTFDVSLVKDGSVMYSREPVVGHWNVAYPMIDISSIGAGGGSIAWVDPVTNGLHVGPQSAGASPGPACYGFGGVEPTVTDANVVLGYLNPDYFVGGRMALYPERALEAVERVASRLGMGVTDTAAGIYEIVNGHMADLIRRMTVERGYDPRDFTLFAFGGAGPVHAAMYGLDLGVQEIVVPSAASVFSAMGLATSDHVYTRSLFDYNALPMDADRFNANFQSLEAAVNADLDRAGISLDNRTLSYEVEMRYGLQYHVVRVPLPCQAYTAVDMDFVAEQFDRVYEQYYGEGSAFTRAGRFIFSFRVEGIGKATKVSFSQRPSGEVDASGAVKGTREAYFKEAGGYVPVNIYAYDRLDTGNIMTGPTIVEAPHTTVVVPPGHTARVDEYLNIVIKQA